MTHRLRYNPFLHASQTFGSMVAALDVDPQTLPTLDLVPAVYTDLKPFRPSARELNDVEKLIKHELGDRETLPRLILLNANSGDLMPLRRWPRERYLDLACHLLQHYPEVCIAFTGSPDEAHDAASMAAAIDSSRCITLGGKTTLRELLVLYCLAEVMVTNDSGPVHYAALTPINVVALYGPETPTVFGPRTPRSEVFWAGIACSPCLSAFNNRWTACTNNMCMQRIGVEAVFDTVCRVYDQRCGSRTGHPTGELEP
jgi:ADP-heptose:LPS heptosyltransferase